LTAEEGDERESKTVAMSLLAFMFAKPTYLYHDCQGFLSYEQFFLHANIQVKVVVASVKATKRGQESKTNEC